MRTFLIFTSQAKHLAKDVLTKGKGFEIVLPDFNREGKRYFPDGEVYMKIVKAAQLKNKRVFVLHSGAPKPNEGLMELELILQILRDSNVKPEVFFTYFPYGMQDKVFEKGETNVAENLVEKLVHYYKVRKIYAIDPHFGGRKWIKKYPFKLLSVTPLLREKAKADFGKDIIFLSPDKGGERRTLIPGFQKKRLDSFRVKIFSEHMELKGKVVGMVDDMIKTGGTLSKLYEVIKKMRASAVIALATHSVLPQGVSRIASLYDALYLTNTISQAKVKNAKIVDIKKLILHAISR